MQQIHINRNKTNSIEFDSPEITVPMKEGEESSFELAIINYGHPTHVHLSTSDELRHNVKFVHDNPYVANQEVIPVVVKLPVGTKGARGEVKVTTGYGMHTESFIISIGVQSVESKPNRMIEVDENLGKPQYIEHTDSGMVDDTHNVYFDDRDDDGPQRRAPPNIPEMSLLPLVMVLLIMAILLATFTFNMIPALYGAVAVSIILMMLMVYAAMHLLAKK